jgi:hypothetical protein
VTGAGSLQLRRKSKSFLGRRRREGRKALLLTPAISKCRITGWAQQYLNLRLTYKTRWFPRSDPCVPCDRGPAKAGGGVGLLLAPGSTEHSSSTRFEFPALEADGGGPLKARAPAPKGFRAVPWRRGLPLNDFIGCDLIRTLLLVLSFPDPAWNSIASCRFVVLRRLEELAGELYYPRRPNPGDASGRLHQDDLTGAIPLRRTSYSPLPRGGEESRPVAGSRPAGDRQLSYRGHQSLHDVPGRRG